MLKMFKIVGHVELWALASAAFTMSACGTFWAGGVAEETNTVAGANEEHHSNYDLVASADTIEVNIDTVQLPTKDFFTPIKSDPQLVITNPPQTSVDEESPHDIISVNTFTGKLNNTDGEALNITVKVYGNDMKTTTDASGYFKLQDLPIGTYPMIVSANNSEIAYLLKNNSNDEGILGPVPSSVIPTVDESDFEEPALQNFVYKDDTSGAGIPGPQPDPNPESSSGTTAYQSSASEQEPVAATNDLPHDFDYGVINQWSDIPNGSTEADLSQDNSWPMEWTVEVSFELGSIDTENAYAYIRYLFGKFDEDSGVIRLAIINGACGTEAPSYALFISSYGNFSCNNAVISTAAVETDKKISLTGTFDGKTLKLYKDGFEIAENTLKIYGLQSYSREPFVFGDENLNLKLNDVRLGEKAITSADVLYRYYR